MYQDENEHLHLGRRMVRPLAGRLARLTPRETEIAKLLVQSKTDKEIAKVLGNIKPSTVSTLIGRMRATFNCKNRSELVKTLQELPEFRSE